MGIFGITSRLLHEPKFMACQFWHMAWTKAVQVKTIDNFYTNLTATVFIMQTNIIFTL